MELANLFSGVDLLIARRLAVALAIGLLIGTERYKARAPEEKGVAGVRTFAALALLGGVNGLLAVPLLTAASFLAVAAVIVVGYFRESRLKPGATTEIASLLAFWLGVLVFHYEILAISAAIVLAILLATKQALHGFVRDSISERELIDTLKFLAVVLVVYPLLPDRDLGPFAFFNPRKVWWLVILVSSISFVGYLSTRILGQRRGLLMAAIAGGLVSTTATTQSLAARGRASPRSAGLLGPALVLANSVQPARLLLLVWLVDPVFGRVLSLPLFFMTATGLFIATMALLRHRGRRGQAVKLEIHNPYSLTSALKFGLFFVLVLFLVRAAQSFLGAAGVYLASALGGGASASAVVLTISGLSRSGAIDLGASVTAVLLAIATNSLVKWVLAKLHGTSRLAWWVAGGQLAMLAAGAIFVVAAAV